ncbi:MAG: coniferyl aldehyde dehydrogenase [Parvibaculales bacterium]
MSEATNKIKLKKSLKDTPVSTMKRIVAAQKKAHLDEGPASVSTRIDRMDRCITLLKENDGLITEAINADFGNRPIHLSMMADVASPIMDMQNAKKNVGKWMRTEKRKTNFPFNLLGARSKVEYQPLGCVGNIVPWNFPVGLTFAPLASIFAAGNRSVVKPSEFTPHTSNLLKALVEEYFDETELAVVTGGPKVGAAFAKLPFDHLLFTGGTAIAPHILSAASEGIVPVTLELGGKSPVIVSDTADFELAAKRIMNGKMMNAGQICLAPDYIMVSKDRHDELVDGLQKAAKDMYPTLKDNPDYTSVINERHYDRINGYIKDAARKDGEIVEINPADEDFRQQEHYKIPPTLILKPSDRMKVMQEEIFGPVLPIKTYDSVQEAITYVNERPHPLAVYYFGQDKEQENRVVSQTTSGGVCVNDVLSHIQQEDLPFGGVGPSGTGAYYGFDGFKNFSHAKAVYRQTKNDTVTSMLRPPYGDKIINLLKTMTK